jgi:hypothetical protein
MRSVFTKLPLQGDDSAFKSTTLTHARTLDLTMSDQLCEFLPELVDRETLLHKKSLLFP